MIEFKVEPEVLKCYCGRPLVAEGAVLHVGQRLFCDCGRRFRTHCDRSGYQWYVVPSYWPLGIVRPESCQATTNDDYIIGRRQ